MRDVGWSDRDQGANGTRPATKEGRHDMEVHTTRFGTLDVSVDEMLSFPEGLPGLEDCRQWVLLPEVGNDAVAWLQSATDPEVALAVVSPRRFVADYQVRVCRKELQALEIAGRDDAQVLAIVSVHDEGPTLNLKAPLVINRRNRVGRQVVTNGEMPMRHALRPAAERHVPIQRRQAA